MAGRVFFGVARLLPLIELMRKYLLLSLALSLSVRVVAQMAADTVQFPATYATALPRPVYPEWEEDYGRYEHFITKEIARTQQGLSYVHEGVHRWWVPNSARPHAQLDTATRILDPTQLVGAWRSILTRVVIHCDSGIVKTRQCYRSAQIIPANVQAEMVFADGKVSFITRDLTTAKTQKTGRKKYALINGRFLLIKGAVSQIGIDAKGRLVVHTSAVVERKIPGQYITYEAQVTQAVFVRQ